MKYCPNCSQNVEPVVACNWMEFTVLLCFFLIPGLIYWYNRKGKVCPICRVKASELQPPKFSKF